VLLVLQCYIHYSGTGIYCKIIHMNSVKYGLMFMQFESGKNFWKLFTETGLLEYASSMYNLARKVRDCFRVK